MARVLVPLASGFEEIEAVTIIDVLRRGGVEVVVAGLAGQGTVLGSHGIALHADAALSEVSEQHFDMLILPGGEPGTTNLAGDERIAALLGRLAREGRAIGAICAAPRVLAARGLLRGRRATSHPSVESVLRERGVEYDGARRVVRDGAVVTSRGPGTALEFSLEVLEMLGGSERAAELRRAMLVGTPV